MTTRHTKEAWKRLMDKVYSVVEANGINPKTDEYTVYQPYAEDGTLTLTMTEDEHGERILSQRISDDVLFLPGIDAPLHLYAKEDEDARELHGEIGRLFMAANDLAVSKGFRVPDEDFTCVQPFKDGQAITVVLGGEGEDRGIRYIVNDSTLVLPLIDEVLHVFQTKQT